MDTDLQRNTRRENTKIYKTLRDNNPISDVLMYTYNPIYITKEDTIITDIKRKILSCFFYGRRINVLHLQEIHEFKKRIYEKNMKKKRMLYIYI